MVTSVDKDRREVVYRGQSLPLLDNKMVSGQQNVKSSKKSFAGFTGMGGGVLADA